MLAKSHENPNNRDNQSKTRAVENGLQVLQRIKHSVTMGLSNSIPRNIPQITETDVKQVHAQTSS